MTAAVLTAADGDLPDIPGQPYVSPDDLASIGPMWQQAVQQQLVPIVAEVYQTSAGVVHAQMVDATQVPTLPSVGSLAAEQYLAAASNTFEQVGDDLWATARSELLDGFEKGESIDQLAARLRASAGMTAKKATLVARTQVLDASNAGSMATARATGIEMNKGWLDTGPPRTRPTHLQAGTAYGSDAGMIPLGDQFTVGGYQCDRPHDPTLPPAERYNCRCSVIFGIPDDSVDDAVRAAEPVPPIPGTSGVVEPLPDPYAGDLVAPALPGPDLGVPAIPGAVPGLAVRPVLEAARTTSAVQSVFAAETRRITGRFIPIRFTGSAATAREHAEGLLRGLERFPDARLGGVDAMEARGAAYAATSYNEILFSEAWTSPAARRRYLGSVATDVQDGWHVANSGNPVAIALHEFGHLLDFTTDINRGVRERIREVVARRAAAEGVGQDVLIRREVSGYATSHTDELVAEAFTDVMINGEAASGLSREIFTLLEDAYRQAGGTVQAVTREALTVPRVAKARAGSTIGDVELGPTQFQIAIGEADLPRRPVGDFTDRPYDGPDGVVVHRGERLPAGFESPLAAIRRGEYTVRPGLSDAESQALDRYVLSRVADPLNTALRQGTAPPFGTVKVVDQVVDLDDVAAQLDSAIAASELSADTTLYRGALMRPADLRKLQPGAITREDAFLSTTTESENAFEIIHWRKGRDPAGGKSPVIFEILAPRGTAGAVADVGEHEVLLGRGRRFRVVEVRRPTTPGGTRRIVLEILPDTPAPLPAPGAAPSLASRTVPQLRALAKERGITIPPGSKKADIVRLLDETPAPPTVAAEAVAGRAALDSIPVHVSTRTLGGLTDDIRGLDRLTARQQQAISDAVDAYRGLGYQGVNAYLRSGEQVRGAKTIIAGVDRAMDLSPLPTPIRLYRGVGSGETTFGPRAGWPADLTGFEWTDLGYPSTSASREIAARGGGAIQLRFVAPQGTKAIKLSEFEQEVLLQRGLRFRVVRDNGPEDFVDGFGKTFHADRVLDVEIIPAGAPPAGVVEVPLAKRTVAQLRALAADRKIVVPKGAKKPDIVRLLETPAAPPTVRPVPAEFAARLQSARKSKSAMAQTEYRFSGNAQENADMFPDPDERRQVMDAFAGYRGIGSARTNKQLRDGGFVGPRVELMDRAFARSHLQDDVVVYRGSRGGIEFGPRETWADDLTGQEWTDRAYTSTSYDPTKARPFAADGVYMRIVAPRGTPAVGLRPAARIEAGEAEILLGRGQRFRVVQDHGSSRPPGFDLPADPSRPPPLRFLDVEVVPVDSAAERAAVRALARETNTLIEQTSATARVLAEVDELLAKKASASTIREAIADALAEPGQLFAGADPAVLAALRAVAADPVKLRAAVTRLGGKAKIKPVSKAGAKVTFDADTMEGVGGIDIEAGARVTVVRRGSTVTLPDGTVMQLEKARVTPVVSPVKAVKAAPVKRAPAAKKAPTPEPPQPVKAVPRGATPSARPVAYQLPPGVTEQDATALRLALKRRQPIEGMPGADNPGLVERLAVENNADYLLGQFQSHVPAAGRMTTAQLQSDLAARAKAAFADRAVATNVANARLEEILTDGRFKTQFETGRSGGIFQPEERRLREEQWFGIPADAAPETRPIYGYLVTSGDGKGMVDVYGGARVVFRDDVRDRTTAQVGDSMEHILTGRPAAVDNPDWYAFTIQYEDPMFAKLDRNYDGPAFNKRSYIEAQIHGGVTVDDIAEVIFTSRPSPELVALLRERGIPWRMRRR